LLLGLPSPRSSGSWHVGSLRLALVTLALGVSLAIVAFGVHPLEPAAQLVLSAVVVLVGLEVVIVGSYQLIRGSSLPSTRWTSLLFGVGPTAAQPPVRRERLWGGLLLLIALLILLGASYMLVSLL
jgi:hypothetical protein